MNKSKLISVILFSLLMGLMSACGDNQGKISIKGSFPGLKNRQIILSEVGVDRTFPMDTTTVDQNGDFRFHAKIDSAGYYIIKADNRNYIMLVLDKESSVKLISDTIPIGAYYTVEGSEDSKWLEDYQNFTSRNIAMVDSIKNVYDQIYRLKSLSNEKTKLDNTYEAIFTSQQEYTRSFIDMHCHSLASLLVINRRFGQRQVLDEREDYAYYFKLDTCLMARYPYNAHVITFHDKVEKIRQQRALFEHMEKKLAVGNKAPDLKMENPQKKTVELYSIKSNCILVYFWSSTDTSCRAMNKNLVDLYKNYGPKGFQVYAVAFESYPSMWKNAIKADHLNWINVSDMMNKLSSAGVFYNIQDRLPFFYVLDKDFIIRYKGDNFRSLEAEVRKLSH